MKEKEGRKNSKFNVDSLLKNLPGMVYRCKNDHDWTMEFISDGCKSLTGYEPKELLKNNTISYGNIIHENDREIVWDNVQKALKAKSSFQLDYRIVTKDEKEKWVWEQGEGILDSKGEIVAIEGFITNITPIARYKNLCDNILEGLQIIDKNWRYVYLNETALKHARLSRAEIEGRTMQQVYPGIEKTDLFSDLCRCMNKIESSIVRENEFEYPDGKKNWYELRLESVPEGILILSMDIQARKQLEIAQIDKQHAEKYEGLSRMGRAVAHNFNTYLDAALGYLNLSIIEMEEELKKSERFKNLKKAKEEAEKALDLSEKMRVYLGFSNGKHEEFDFTEISSNYLASCREEMPKKVILEYSLLESGLIIKANPKRIKDILNYLVTNAIEAIKEYPGEGKISVTSEKVDRNQIPRHSCQPIGWKSYKKTYVCLTVKDTGCGMEDDTISKIFEPFFTTKKDSQVYGMGLPMISGIVNSLNGCIVVTSGHKLGSTFKVYLPIEYKVSKTSSRKRISQPSDRCKIMA